MTPDFLVCPESSAIPATGATTREVAKDYAGGGHISYIYFAASKQLADLSRDDLMLADRPHNHADGGHVVSRMGSVQYVHTKDFNIVIHQAQKKGGEGTQ
jgi:hypothetical protein